MSGHTVDVGKIGVCCNPADTIRFITFTTINEENAVRMWHLNNNVAVATFQLDQEVRNMTITNKL